MMELLRFSLFHTAQFSWMFLGGELLPDTLLIMGYLVPHRLYLPILHFSSLSLILTLFSASLFVYDKTTSLEIYASFGWGRITFLPSGWYRAVFWICGEHRIDNTEMFLLFLSRVYTEPRTFLHFVLPQWWGGWGPP